MSAAVREELLLQHVAARKDDPEIEARRLHILQVLLEHTPEVRQELIEEGIEKGIEEGIEKGIEKGRAEGLVEGGLRPLVRLFSRRLGRDLSDAERARLAERVRVQGAEQIGDLVIDLSPEDLATWLAATNGH